MLSELFRLLGDLVCPGQGGSSLPKWPYDHISGEDIDRMMKKK